MVRVEASGRFLFPSESSLGSVRRERPWEGTSVTLRLLKTLTSALNLKTTQAAPLASASLRGPASGCLILLVPPPPPRAQSPRVLFPEPLPSGDACPQPRGPATLPSRLPQSWLGDVERTMRVTLRDLLRNCRVALKKFLNKRDKWVKEWAGQVSWGGPGQVGGRERRSYTGAADRKRQNLVSCSPHPFLGSGLASLRAGPLAPALGRVPVPRGRY